MKLNLERSGGFTGIPLRVAVDTETLEPKDREALLPLVAASGFFQLPAQISAPTAGVDRFTYRLSIEDGGRSHTVEVAEGAMPDSLQPLIQRLIQLGRGARA